MGGNCRDIALGKIQCVRDRDMKSINMFPILWQKTHLHLPFKEVTPSLWLVDPPFLSVELHKRCPWPMIQQRPTFPMASMSTIAHTAQSSSLGDIEATLGLGDGSRSVFLGDAGRLKLREMLSKKT